MDVAVIGADTREYARAYRRKNTNRRAYQAWAIRKEWRRKLFDHIGGAICVDCGLDDERVLEFDHTGDKVANVAAFLGKNWSKALAEAEKCEVVCANCHAIRTHERRPMPVEIDTEWRRNSKTHCRQGHEKTADTYVPANNGRTFRCLLCCRERNRVNAANRRRNAH